MIHLVHQIPNLNRFIIRNKVENEYEKYNKCVHPNDLEHCKYMRIIELKNVTQKIVNKYEIKNVEDRF